MPTAHSIPGFLRPDELKLSVIWLISPFSGRCCLPGRQLYLCLQQPETKSFSSPVIFSLRNTARVKPVGQACEMRCGVQEPIGSLDSCQVSGATAFVFHGLFLFWSLTHVQNGQHVAFDLWLLVRKHTLF